jgi:hypothetical protein
VEANASIRDTRSLARIEEEVTEDTLADAGYWNDDRPPPRRPRGAEALLALERHPAYRTCSSPSARLRARMPRRLTSPSARALYVRRRPICEPASGDQAG